MSSTSQNPWILVWAEKYGLAIVVAKAMRAYAFEQVRLVMDDQKTSRLSYQECDASEVRVFGPEDLA